MSSTIRTFRASDSRSALAAVKSALGPNAVIIDTREVPGGLFRKAEVEVTAALLDESSPRAAAPKAGPVVAPAASRGIEPRGVEPRFLEGYAGQRGTQDAQGALAEELARLRSELAGVRRQLQNDRREPMGGMSEAGVELFRQMCLNGVEETLAEDAVRQACADACVQGPAATAAAVRAVLGERLVGGRAPWLPSRRRVIALVGPTGVGKTTTLAKVAARALLEGRQSVALVTVDTYRIGASEQVARYGAIMNVPTFVAKDRTELNRVLTQCAGVDLVLVDTAGRSTHEAVAKQAELIRSVPGIQLYLVLSAAAGGRELGAVAERYRLLSPERLLVTKADEALGSGSVLSAAVRLGRPICGVADGQRVPEDIHAVSGPELVELIIGGRGVLARAGGR